MLNVENSKRNLVQFLFIDLTIILFFSWGFVLENLQVNEAMEKMQREQAKGGVVAVYVFAQFG